MTHPFLQAWRQAMELTVASYRSFGILPPAAGTALQPPAERVLALTADDVIPAAPQLKPGQLRGQVTGATGTLDKLDDQLTALHNLGGCSANTCQQLLSQTDQVRQALLDLNTVLTRINSLAIKR